MSSAGKEDIWGGLDDDDILSVEEIVVIKNNRDHPPPKPSTSRLCTQITSVASLGTRLGDIVESASKKQKQLNRSIVIHVQTDKKRKVYGRKKLVKETPLRSFKYGRLWVTDITTQFWCELQMVFKYEPPPALVGIEIVPKAEVVTGKALHLVRERLIEKPVEVKVTSNEDRFALKVLSLLDGVLSLVKYGVTVRREIHIFGTPFNMGVYVSGIIDEIRCHPNTLELEIVEFKTRMTDCMPPEAQKLTHNIQVMLYKRLFDEMVNGTFSKETVAANFWMNLDRPLGEDLMAQSVHKEANTLSKLLDLLVETMRGVPFISSLLVEYAFQKDGSTIGYTAIEYDEAWIREKLAHALSYWKGERDPQGVTIEECWKCIRCDYSSDCKWKSALVKKHSLKAVKEIQPPEERQPSQEEKIDPWNSSADSVESVFSAQNESNDVVDTDVVFLPALEEQNMANVDSDDSVILLHAERDDEIAVEH